MSVLPWLQKYTTCILGKYSTTPCQIYYRRIAGCCMATSSNKPQQRLTKNSRQIWFNQSKLCVPNLQCHVRTMTRKVAIDVNDLYYDMKNPKVIHFLKHLEKQLDGSQEGNSGMTENLMRKKPLIEKAKTYWMKEQEKQELVAIIQEESDPDMVEMAQNDIGHIETSMNDLEENIISMMVPIEREDDTDVILELTAGVGGQEAMLFTADILNMYRGYAAYNGWGFEVIQEDSSEQGGIRKASAAVSGHSVHRQLKYEGGVHRVQRVPKTERSGRIHTSTMSVAIMPQPSQIDVVIDAQKDLKITTMKASGAGGQHVNTTDSAVRMTHLPTGISVAMQQSRSQIKNRQLALQVLRSKLFEKELESRQQKTLTHRKLQVGSSGRSEKIRTYNFQQDRVTDHRIGENIGNIREFLTGGEGLQGLIDSIQDVARTESLGELLEQFDKSIKTET